MISAPRGSDPQAEVERRLQDWAIEAALPLWAEAGFDRVRGGFHERLLWDGSPDTTAGRRTRVQARQIYVYAHAAVLGWYPDGLPLALRALEFLLAKCRSPDGRPGYIHRLDAENAIADPLRDTYDHAFILLALAWLARASGDAQARALIDETLAFMDEHLAAEDGTFREGLPPSQPRRQNPHMHIFEAMLALHETIAYPGALQRAGRLRALLEDKFLDPLTRTIGEYFTDDWRPLHSGRDDIVEPGHHAEWCWLIRRHERMSALAPASLAADLLATAVSSAEARTGLLRDGADRSGHPRRLGRRCWPQTELAKAWLAEHELGRAGAANRARRAMQAMADEYLAGPFAGGWIDQFDAAGKPIVGFVPASTFYHLFGAIAEARRVL